MADRGRPSKRNHNGYPVIASDEQISEWLEELNEEGDFSDVDDSVADPDFVADVVELESGQGIQEVSDGSIYSENDSSGEEDNLPPSLRANSARGRGVTNYISKNGYLWSIFWVMICPNLPLYQHEVHLDALHAPYALLGLRGRQDLPAVCATKQYAFSVRTTYALIVKLIYKISANFKTDYSALFCLKMT